MCFLRDESPRSGSIRLKLQNREEKGGSAFSETQVGRQGRGLTRQEKRSFIERAKTTLISCIGYWAIRLIGASLRWEVVGIENLQNHRAAGRQFIMTFWHGRIFAATYYWRNRGIVVMTSRNRDGDYIARVIERFGYKAARGSSSRGSLAATVECLRAMKNGRDLGLTIDGPRGPRYVAKPGAAYMARKSGNPVVPFNISAERKWVARSWDRFEIPWPFTRALVLIGDPIYVGDSAEEIERAEAQIQQALDRLRIRGDAWWTRSEANGRTPETAGSVARDETRPGRGAP